MVMSPVVNLPLRWLQVHIKDEYNMEIIVTHSMGTITFDDYEKFTSWLKLTVDNFRVFSVEIVFRRVV